MGPEGGGQQHLLKGADGDRVTHCHSRMFNKASIGRQWRPVPNPAATTKTFTRLPGRDSQGGRRSWSPCFRFAAPDRWSSIRSTPESGWSLVRLLLSCATVLILSP